MTIIRIGWVLHCVLQLEGEGVVVGGTPPCFRSICNSSCRPLAVDDYCVDGEWGNIHLSVGGGACARGSIIVIVFGYATPKG